MIFVMLNIIQVTGELLGVIRLLIPKNSMALDKKDPSFKNQFLALRHLPRLFAMIWETNRTLTLANIILRLTKSVIPLAMLFVAKEIIDQIVDLTNGKLDSSAYLWKLVTLELGLAIGSEILNRCIILTDNLLGDLFSNKTSVILMQHAADLDLYHFENPSFYDKLERARRQTTGRTVLMSMVLAQAQDLLTVLSLGTGLVVFSPWLLLILIVAVFPSFISESYFNQKTYSLIHSWTPERRELDYLRYIGASDETAKEVKLFGLSNFLVHRFATLSHRYYLANRKLVVSHALWSTLLSALGTVAYYGAYFFIIMQTLSGAITIGALTFLSGGFQRMQNSLQGIMTQFSRIAQSALYLEDFFEFLTIKPNIFSKSGSLAFPEKLSHGFAFENVGFKYPDSDKWVLRNVSFRLAPGEKIALVGENGAGKTTLVKLLARLYEPTEGSITIEGIDIKDYNLQSLRTHIGVIFQDYIKFQMKVYENIAIGGIDDIEERAAIEQAAYKSLANTVIEGLPEKYEQLLGRRFEKGVELSGGQWQKIALARAYMRQAQLLILDEPTSALDARSEHEVFLRFSELVTGKSAILISHRFSTVRMADRILVLENGNIVESGSHKELLALGGKYAELFHLQAKGYS